MERSVTVLLVESNEICRKVLEKFTHGHFEGCNVLSVTDAEEAVSVLKAVHVDIVVCDAHLTKQKKINFIHRLCTAAKPPLALIVITGESDLHNGDIHEEVCVKKLIYKPVKLAEVGTALREAIAEVKDRRR